MTTRQLADGPPATGEKKVLISVQRLRAVAATMVVVHHALFYTNTARGLPADADRQLFGFAAWSFGIHIFFLVSGFIMINSATGFGEPGAWRQFLKRRLIRIVPLYWLVTAVYVAILLAAPSMLPIAADKPVYILKSFLFIPVLRAEGDLRPLIGQGWTLDYEMFFYALFALAMLLPRGRAVLALSLAFPALAWLGRDLTTASPILFTWTDGLILEFLFGVYVGLAWRAGYRLPGWAAYASIAAGFALDAFQFHAPTALIDGVPATLVLAGAALGPQPRETASRSWLARIGNASYSLYLTHTIVLHPAWRIWTALGGAGWPPVLFVLFAIAASVCVGLLVYRFVERPLTRTLQRRWLSATMPHHRQLAPAAP